MHYHDHERSYHTHPIQKIDTLRGCFFHFYEGVAMLRISTTGFLSS